MRNTLTMVVALTMGCAMVTLLPAQEPVQFTPQRALSVGDVAVSGTVVAGAPYSAVAVTETTQTLGDGNRILRSRSRKVSRDSLGRERTDDLTATTGAASQAAATISDPVAKVSYRLIAKTRTAVEGSLRTAPVFAAPVLNPVLNSGGVTFDTRQIEIAIAELADEQAAAKQPGQTTVKENLAPQTIEGVFAIGTRSALTIPAGQIGNERPILVVDEEWYSPDLKMNVMTRHSDPRAAETVYRLTQINRSEPDPSLFQVPPGYTLVRGGASGIVQLPAPPPPPR